MQMSPKRYKYPRTPHLPWSPGRSEDDLLLSTTDAFQNQVVVITEKLDGENTTLYSDYLHARSTNSNHHPSRTWIKALQAAISHEIPVGWRICGENVYAQHSIAYSNLSSYFFMFSIWNNDNECLSWDETEEWAGLLGLELPPILYKGKWNNNLICSLSHNLNLDNSEGYVVRLAECFHYQDFKQYVAKWVRTGHTQTTNHWMHSDVVPNHLRQDIKIQHLHH
jgi:hypothetical protein